MKIPERIFGIAKEFADKYKVGGVIGIVFLGGLGRGCLDKYSDIDITKFFWN